VVVSIRISINVEFSKTLMNPRVVQGQNKLNCKNQRKSLDKELYEYYCLGLWKRLNNSRHHIHYLAE
jgi:hypothetical protein